MEMDVELPEGHEGGAHHGSSLGARVAITIALLATFLGLCKIKSDNLVERMQKLQIDRLDQWNFYQARNIREEIDRAALAELKLNQTSAPASSQTAYADAVKASQAAVEDQSSKKESVRAQAEEDETSYERLEFRHDQFNLCEAAIALAISILALTALTRQSWLYFVALAPGAGGVLMGVAGLASWHLHPDFMLRWLQ